MIDLPPFLFQISLQLFRMIAWITSGLSSTKFTQLKLCNTIVTQKPVRLWLHHDHTETVDN